jgi:amino acid transporter
MNALWSYIDKKNWKAEKKYKAVLKIAGIAGALAGLCIWALVRNWAFTSLDWMFCFIGYPAIISCLIAILYLYNHSFHNGSIERDITEKNKEERTYGADFYCRRRHKYTGN